MAKADLHVHSSYSAHPSTWFLQRLGTRESYVDPEVVYEKALEEGMDFVTITDHNSIEGSLLLAEKYPHRAFTGLEATTYFPEDKAKIHILIWGLSSAQFLEIEKLRENIYALREYLVAEDLIHAVAHATFSLNRVITIEHVERLFLLFDCFEGINGNRSRASNEALLKALSGLTRSRMRELEQQYRITPRHADSWRKSVVGGSDDHSGLFVGKTYTVSDGDTPRAFLEGIRDQRTAPAGRHNDYQGLAVAMYKVAFDFSRSRNSQAGFSFFNALNTLIFDGQTLGFKSRIALEKMRLSKGAKENDVKRMLLQMVEALKDNRGRGIEGKLAVLDKGLTEMTDALFVGLFDRLSRNVNEGNMMDLIKSVSGALPGLFLSLPFFTTMNMMNESRELSDQLLKKYAGGRLKRKKRVLWFSDTLSDLNGVSATLVKLANLSKERELDLQLVGCLTENEAQYELPGNLVKLPCIYTYTPEFFDTYTLRVPSVLASMKLIYDADPDEIYISTPGPVGFIGVLLAKLLHIPCAGIYHTDFTKYAKEIIGDDFISKFVQQAVGWFYSCMDTIKVSTHEYISILEKRGYDRSKMVRFRRGIDANLFSPRWGNGAQYLLQKCGIEDGITLIHPGRVSKEKNMDFLGEVYERMLRTRGDINLVFAGDGPYLKEFKAKMSCFPRVHFLGRVPRHELPELYSASHGLVFPSTTDTFGMVVLEAHACGLPAIVASTGGPKEIVVAGKTGYVAESNDMNDWVKKTLGLIEMADRYPDLHLEMREYARKYVVSNFDWDLVLQDIFRDWDSGAADKDSPRRNPFDDAVKAGSVV